MITQILSNIAAIATVASFLLELWKFIKDRM
jgi:hypothetical protein